MTMISSPTIEIFNPFNEIFFDTLKQSEKCLEQPEHMWFPTHVSDIDRYADNILSGGCELEADHPGFRDEVYRNRRRLFEDIARDFRFGQQIPRVDYSPQEIATWSHVYRKLTALYPKYACREFNAAFELLRQRQLFKEHEIPQLQDVSDFLRERSGFTLRPVAGLLSPRHFLAGLAFKVFHSTQYIRHGSSPDYTPEPDICHELLGHVPMFADPEFAQFSQEIGLASLGASDETIEQLSTLYWFTVEFGLCLQDGERKVYGASLLSAFGELEYAMTDKPEIRPFDPEIVCRTAYPITSYQPTYFLAESFASAKEKMRYWATTIERPFTLRFIAETNSVEVLKKCNA